MGKASRPAEVSARKPVSQFKKIFEDEPKPKRVDPRFSNIVGHFNQGLYDASYGFLGDLKQKEEKGLRSEARRLRTAKKPHALEKKEEVHQQLQEYKYERTNKARHDAERAQVREWRRSEREKVSAGKKPFFLKKSAQKEELLKQKFTALKKSGKLDTYLQKQRKKQVCGVGGCTKNNKQKKK